MARLGHPHQQYGARGQRGGHSRGGGAMPANSRFNDVASYATDTSSITNPVELGSFDDDEDDSVGNENDDGVVSFGVDDATSVLTGLTGWTSANAAATEVSELGASEAQSNFPIGASKSYRSAYTEDDHNDGDGGEEAGRGAAMALSFETDGSIEISPKRSGRKPKEKGGRGGDTREPLMVIPLGRAVHLSAPSPSNCTKSPRSSKGKGYGAHLLLPTASVQSCQSGMSHSSRGSNWSKKRHPIPPLRDPAMDDDEKDQQWEENCNYDINSTLMFLVLESRDWVEAVSLLDGKGLENRNDMWNLGSLFGVKSKREEDKAKEGRVAETRKKELRSQAQTWIIRSERNGVLRWRMLPLHAAMAFTVRNRDDKGMLALHHCFKYGANDQVLELLLNVFPEALTVRDNKGRLPLPCMPRNGNDNERRSHISTLFADFQVELARKKMGLGEAGEGRPGGLPPPVAPLNSRTTSLRAREGKVWTSPAGTLSTARRYDAPGLGYGQVARALPVPRPQQDAGRIKGG
ncbi:hypothetical protein ACHAWF_013948 [Thalassiosira exigua]